MRLLSHIMARAEEGAKVIVSLSSHSVAIDGVAVDLSEWAESDAASPNAALAEIEHAFDVYRRSLSSEVEPKNRHEWFHAGPCSEDEILWGEDRSLARLRLELTVLRNILNGSLTPDTQPFIGKWFWQSAVHPELVILREWL